MTRALIVLAVMLVVGPVALSLFCDLPPLVFAIPPAVLYIGTWIFFRQLDSPPKPRPPRRRAPPRPPAPRPDAPGARPRRKQRAPVIA